MLDRRGFLHATGGLAFLSRLPAVPRDQAAPDPASVRLDAGLEPLVRLVEETPRAKLIEEAAARVKKGLSYRELLAALFLAGVRNIRPRPSVGFKFHTVLVVHSAHLASLASPDSDRWLPLFWALDYFKSAQTQAAKEGKWTLPAADETNLPPPSRARQAFQEAMDDWDEAKADRAATALARSAGTSELFELFCKYGARDFRSIGHKAIYVSNAFRTIAAIGRQHAEPVLRSLAYALLARENDDPKGDSPADRPYRRNRERAAEIRADWQDGKTDGEATREMLSALRDASDDGASKKAVELLNRGASPQAVWDAVFQAAGELLMKSPGIVSLHSVTFANAARYAYGSVGEEMKRLLVLQAASFLTLYRAAAEKRGGLKDHKIDALEPQGAAPESASEIFAEAARDRMAAARKALAFLDKRSDPEEFMREARLQILHKGNDPHDYKFSEAALEDYNSVSAPLRARFLAAAMFQLRPGGGQESGLVGRIREALR